MSAGTISVRNPWSGTENRANKAVRLGSLRGVVCGWTDWVDGRRTRNSLSIGAVRARQLFLIWFQRGL